MTAVPILKTLLHHFGRNPLPEDSLHSFPQLKLYLAYETAELEYPALVAAASLSESEPALAKNAATAAEITFTLLVPADDFTSAEHAEMLEAVSELLCASLTTDNAVLLNAHAEEAGAESLFFYGIHWTETGATQAQDRLLSTEFRFAAKVQF